MVVHFHLFLLLDTSDQSRPRTSPPQNASSPGGKRILKHLIGQTKLRTRSTLFSCNLANSDLQCWSQFSCTDAEVHWKQDKLLNLKLRWGVNIARLDSVSTLFALDTALQFAASIASFNAALTFVVEISQYANKVFFDNMQIWDATHRILRRRPHLGAILD